jgi:hypothetical protein
MKAVIAILAVSTATSLCTAGNGQSARPISVVDPFVAAVETMKHSVAPLICISGNGAESKLLARTGTAFFTSTAEFLTAAHVIEGMQQSVSSCPVTAVLLPPERWQPDTLDEPAAWFSFKIGNCALDHDLDVAKCPLTDDLTKVGLSFKIVPVKFDWSIPPDATPVAFTGFPTNARDPITLRANVAAYRPAWRNKRVVPELLLDRFASPGSSGSPVFLPDGRVVGILTARTDDGTEMTNIRPVSAVRAWLESLEKK